MRIAKREDQREKMLEVIEHDVRRLDRLVSDISNASRLDSELVKEEEETFDLMYMMGNLNEFLGKEAGAKGYVGVSANSDYDAKIAVLRQLLAWEREMSSEVADIADAALFDDRIYVLTPNAAIVEVFTDPMASERSWKRRQDA